MNWDKARNYTIFFLIVFNIIIFTFGFQARISKRMTNDQRQDIVNILRQNGITVKCELPRSRKTVGQLMLRRLDFDYLKLQKIFLDDQSNVKRIDAEDKITISNGAETLTVEGNHIEYKNTAVHAADKAQAQKAAKTLVKDIHEYFGNFYMYSSDENGEQYNFRFTEKVSGLKVYNNIISVSVYKTGGLRLGLSYLQTGEHYGGKMTAIPCDEALFSAMPYILEYEGENKELNITNVELCYYLHRIPADEGIAIPCYRITVNWDKIYYINAYTGDLVN